MDRDFLADLRWWANEQPRIVSKVLDLADECRRDSRIGTGKPEQLRHRGEDAHLWSRHNTGEHRLVYRVDDAERLIDFLQCRYHYGK
jgi:toxin YoeB